QERSSPSPVRTVPSAATVASAAPSGSGSPPFTIAGTSLTVLMGRVDHQSEIHEVSLDALLPPCRSRRRCRGAAHRGLRTRRRPVLRAEQGPLPHVPFPGAQDRPLRHLLLPRGARGGGAGGPDGRAMVRPPVPDPQPPAQRAAAHHPLR